MSFELTEGAVIDFFKRKLRSIEFFAESEYIDIEQKLDTLADPKENKARKIEACNWLWKLFIRRALNSITDNMRGYINLCSYYDDYVDYEYLLFALDENHRDHVIHSIWVMMSGLYLQENLTPIKYIYYNFILARGLSKAEEKRANKYLDELQEEVEKHKIALWCLIALTHDLGYPIEKTKAANIKMAKMINRFGFLDQKDFNYNFTIVHQTAINELLNLISRQFTWDSRGGYRLTYDPGIRLDFAKSFERLNHGIMSAYLLVIYLDCICEMMALSEEIEGVNITSREEVARLVVVSELLLAISAHSNDNFYWDTLDTVDAVLFLVDELEEFSRYSRSPTTDAWINVRYRTEVGWGRKSLKIIYTLDNRDVIDDIEEFFKNKVAGVYNRIEVTEGNIEKLCIICRDVRRTPMKQFTYEKRVSWGEKEIVKRKGGRSSTDVLGFLEGKKQL